jgi:predicted ArsR family transcriptional regulator
LDRLVQDGLLTVEFRKLGGRGGPGSGRPAKLYLAAVREVAASVPDRNYDLAAELLVSAIEESTARGGSAQEALVRTARARGLAAARAKAAPAGQEDERADAGGAGFAAFLAAEGYRPADDGEGGLVLLNCPFHRIADGHTEVVCAMNGAFLGGAAAGCGIDPDRVQALAIDELRAAGAALPAQCCARIRP